MGLHPRNAPLYIGEYPVELRFKRGIDERGEAVARFHAEFDQVTSENDRFRCRIRDFERVGGGDELIDTGVDFRRRERWTAVGVRAHDKSEVVDRRGCEFAGE